MSTKSHSTEKRLHCNQTLQTKYVPLCRRMEPPSPTRKIARIQPLVATPSASIQRISTEKRQPTPQVVFDPPRCTGSLASPSSAPPTPDAIPRPKIIPPLPPLTIFIDRVVTHPTLLRRNNRSTPGLRRFRSKSASVMRQPSFCCIPEKDEELESVPKVQFSLHSPPT